MAASCLQIVRRLCHTFSRKNAEPFDAIPSAKGLPLIGTLWDIYESGGARHIHEYIDARHRQLGPMFRETLGHVQAVWLCDTQLYRQVYQNEGKYPQLMLPEPWLIFNAKHGYRRGLFFMQGQEWEHFRKIVGPLLMKKMSLDKHAASFDEIAQQLVDGWKHQQVVVDLETDLYTYFIQCLMCVVFGKEIALNSSIWNQYIPTMVAHLKDLFEYSGRLTLFPPGIAAKLRLKVWKRFESAALGALQLGNKLTVACMDRHSEQQSPGNSLVTDLQQLGISTTDIERIVTDLFLAAADTSSHTMMWVLYSLGRNMPVQDRVDEEMASREQVGGVHEASQNLSLLKACVKEASRLYPVATFLTRIMPEDCVINNYQIPAKTLVLLSTYSSGRQEKYFERANCFRPERWLRSDVNYVVHDHYASLPFGHGKRSCVGRRLVESQMYILLYKILQKYHLQVTDEVKLVMRFLGTVDQPVKLQLRPRFLTEN